MLSPRALTTTSESGNSRRAAMDHGESTRPTNYHRTATCRPSDQAVQTDKEQAQREQNDCRNRGAFYPAMPDAWTIWRRMLFQTYRHFGCGPTIAPRHAGGSLLDP